jgi:hypothetical protein
VLGEHGLSGAQLGDYLNEDPRSFVEKEYAQAARKP